MEVPPFARPNRASPSAWEADFLERTNLTMSTVEYALPTAIMTSPSFVAEGAGGSQICAMYSFQAFSEMINERNAEPGMINVFLLPHLPLNDVSDVYDQIGSGDAPYRISNGPMLLNKVNAYRELIRVGKELAPLEGLMKSLEDELLVRLNSIVSILKSDGEDIPLPLDMSAATQLLFKWESDFVEACEMATKARRRLMLATLAMFWSSSDDFVENEFSVREGDAISMSHVQETLQRLAPDLYQNVFGALNEVHYTEDGRPPKSVVVSLKRLITEITSEMTPTEFVAFSLETSRRDLIHQLSDVSHQEFRLKVLRSLQSVASALIRLHMLDKEMLEPHLSRPTLLGCKEMDWFQKYLYKYTIFILGLKDWFDFCAKGGEEELEESEEERKVDVVSKLHAILRPFLLRRMKVDVEHMLP
uniref:Uncharacterized protein n=1 Tax=Oryza glumipatula TaxID=40148 RepID=A0A0D9YYX8_9ORYZ